MADLTNAGGGPIKKTVAGQEVEFSELTFYDRRDMLRKFREDQRAALKSLLSDHGIPPEQQYLELRQFDQEVVGTKIWGEYFNSDEGQEEILRRSLEKGKPGNGRLVKDLTLTPDEMMQVCAAVTHTPLIKKDGNPANPQTGGQGVPIGFGK